MSKRLPPSYSFSNCLPPVISFIVAYQSQDATGTEQYPCFTPGPVTIVGTLMPPSQSDALPPDKGAFPRNPPPLSEVKIIYVLSAISSFSK